MAKALTLKTVFAAVDKMTGPMKTITARMGKFNHAAGIAGKVGLGVAKGIGILGGAALAAGAAVSKAAISFAERGDDIARNAAILGLSAEAYQELAYAANLADVESEAFASATKKLNNNLGQLKTGTGSLASLLEKTNPALAQQLATTEDTSVAFDLMAEAIAAETDVAKRAALAQAAFGKSGQDLIPMMEGLAKARAEAKRSGSIISDKDIAAASRLDDAMKRIRAAASGPINHALAMVAERMAPIIERVTEWISANREIIGQRLEQLFAGISKVADAAGRIFASLAPALKPLWDLTMALLPAIVAVGDAVAAILGPVAKLVGWIAEGLSKIIGGGVPNPAMASAGPGNSIAPISSSTSSTSRSELAVSFANAPAGTGFRQTGSAPGITVNTGRTFAGAGGAH